MKKLMIAAAIVCAAAMSQAASMEWGSNLAISSSANVEWEGYADIGTQYILFSLDSAVTDITKFSFDGTSLSLDGEKLTQLDSHALTPDEYDSSMFRGVTQEGTAADLNGYYAIVQYDANADKDLYSVATYQMSAVADDGGAKTLDAANNGDSVQLSTAGDLGSAGTWQTVAAVPEPTSGLLLLLGVAGLALRRRRA